MTDYTKPLVYNPKVAEEKIAELEALVTKQMWAVIRVKEENTKLKLQLDDYESLQRIIDSQHRTIKIYNKIFRLQEAELSKLRGDKHT